MAKWTNDAKEMLSQLVEWHGYAGVVAELHRLAKAELDACDDDAKAVELIAAEDALHKARARMGA